MVRMSSVGHPQVTCLSPAMSLSRLYHIYVITFVNCTEVSDIRVFIPVYFKVLLTKKYG